MKLKSLAALAALAVASCAATTDPATGVQTTKPDTTTVTSFLDIIRAVLVPAPPVAVEVEGSAK